MVRVGGGWVTLDEFLETNDPCRGISEDIYPTFYFILFYFFTRKPIQHVFIIYTYEKYNVKFSLTISLEYTRLWISHYYIYVYTCTM